MESLVFEKQTWGFNDPVLVGLGGVAVTRTVYKTLHHFSFYLLLGLYPPRRRSREEAAQLIISI